MMAVLRCKISTIIDKHKKVEKIRWKKTLNFLYMGGNNFSPYYLKSKVCCRYAHLGIRLFLLFYLTVTPFTIKNLWFCYPWNFWTKGYEIKDLKKVRGLKAQVLRFSSCLLTKLQLHSTFTFLLNVIVSDPESSRSQKSNDAETQRELS